MALADRVFDVIGEVLSLNDVNLPEMLREAANDPRRLDEYLDQIERIDPKRLLQYEQATGIALARANVDFSGFQTANAEAEERRLMPRYIEQHFWRNSIFLGLPHRGGDVISPQKLVLSPLRGSFFVLHLLPMAHAMGHILPPLGGLPPLASFP